ncbi:MAG: FecR domain-containing protein [Polyangiaceae bacterium]
MKRTTGLAPSLQTWVDTARREQDAALAATKDAHLAESVVALRAALAASKGRNVRSTAPRFRTWVFASAAFALLAGVLLVASGRFRSHGVPMAFTTFGQEGRLGDAYGEPASVVPFRFTDGTVLELDPGSRGRVTSIAPTGARLVLEHGKVHANVVPTKESRWQVSAGPFDVHVRGTVFDAAWDEVTRKLHVKMVEGHVAVTASCLVGEVHLYRGDDRDVACPEGPSSPEPPATLAAPSLAPATAPAVTTPRVLPGGSSAGLRRTKETEMTSDPTKADDPAPAPSAPSAPATVTIPGDLSVADAHEVMRLGDEARLRGDLVFADRAYQVALGRTPSSVDAARAHYLLGTFARDRGEFAVAEGHFVRVVELTPPGELRTSADGRLFEIARARGDANQLRARALRYVEEHPSGPLADEARALLR